jgi:hypothetical protein
VCRIAVAQALLSNGHAEEDPKRLHSGRRGTSSHRLCGVSSIFFLLLRSLWGVDDDHDDNDDHDAAL